MPNTVPCLHPDVHHVRNHITGSEAAASCRRGVTGGTAPVVAPAVPSAARAAHSADAYEVGDRIAFTDARGNGVTGVLEAIEERGGEPLLVLLDAASGGLARRSADEVLGHSAASEEEPDPRAAYSALLAARPDRTVADDATLVALTRAAKAAGQTYYPRTGEVERTKDIAAAERFLAVRGRRDRFDANRIETHGTHSGYHLTVREPFEDAGVRFERGDVVRLERGQTRFAGRDWRGDSTLVRSDGPNYDRG